MAALPTITDVRLTPILIADPPLLNLSGVHQPYTPRLIVEVLTSSGVSGLGETYGDSVYSEQAAALSRDLIGVSIGAVNTVAGLGRGADALLDGAPAASGLRGALTTDKVRSSVVSAFEVAVLDALGRHLGVPVHTLLGGAVRDRVEYSGYLFYKWAEHPDEGVPGDDWGAALDPAAVVAQARKFQAYGGFRSFKLKGGVRPPEEEIAAVRALAVEFPAAPLRLDPNGGWSLKTALRVAEELSGTIEYLEDPTAGLDDMAEVHRRTGIPLATNMIVTSFEEVGPAFERDAVQIVLSDHHFWGGLLATRDLAAVCRTWGRGLSMHSNTHLGVSLAAMTHVAATVSDLRYACDTHYPWQSEDVITERFRFTDGAIEVPRTPGLGVELDRDALARLHERWKALPRYRNRDDVAAMRRVDPAYAVATGPKF
ncbi:glucarate dehydratase family protein [Nocardia pseudobrasiliensis]|uniref:glucarate dehydratase n=1 Tax=Nocardia pseudobrasiliensis TaxID=45979 RepID=A0A370I7J1_9NOCA|nr:glucarate dehydratase family protein [Nocardia pseudobrasiliensis]RDI66685.1 glucarate dehydratase [Nocardia pseudobrasiliensis]